MTDPTKPEPVTPEEAGATADSLNDSAPFGDHWDVLIRRKPATGEPQEAGAEDRTLLRAAQLLIAHANETPGPAYTEVECRTEARVLLNVRAELSDLRAQLATSREDDDKLRRTIDSLWDERDDLRAQLATVTRELANERERTSLYAEQRDRARAEGLGLMQERDEAREHAAKWKAAAEADSRRLDALEKERNEARAEGERLLQATVDNLLDGEQERLARVHADGLAEGECLGVAKVLAEAEKLSYPVGVMGGRAVDFNVLRARLREHSTALSDYVRAAQAEALEEWATDIAPRRWEYGFDVLFEARERAASLRKGPTQ